MKFFRGIISGLILLNLISCETEVNITPNDTGTFVKFYGGNFTDAGYDAIEFQNGFAIVGSTESFGNGGEDVFLVLTDENGNYPDQVGGSFPTITTYGGNGNDVGRSIIETSNGNLLIVGEVTDTSTLIPNLNILILEINPSTLAIVDSVSIGTDLLDERGFSVAETLDGGFIVSGSKQALLGLSDTDSYILKLDANLQIEWENDDALLGLADDTGNSIIATDQGDFVYSSTSQRESEEDFTDMRLTSLNTIGQINWNFFFGEGGQNETASALYGGPGNVYSIGTQNEGDPDSDVFLVRTSLGGIGLDELTIDLGGQDEGKSVTELSDGNIAILAESEGDLVVIKYNVFGDELWDNRPTLGSEENDIAAKIFETSDQGIAVIGTITFAGSTMALFAKFNKDGELEK